MSLFRSFEGFCGVALVSLLIVLALKLYIYRVVQGASMIADIPQVNCRLT